jgi:hypothetical protein
MILHILTKIDILIILHCIYYLTHNKYIISTMISEDKRKFISYVFSMILFGTTIWLCAYNDHELLKWWYISIMSLLLIIRIPNFFKRKWHHFLYEMCYFVNIYTFFNFGTGGDIKQVFPFLHGPLMMYAIVFRDAFIPHNFQRSTSYWQLCKMDWC